MACTNEARTNVQQIINNILPSIVNSIQVCDVNCQYCHLRLYIYPLRQRKVIPYVSLLGVYTRSVSTEILLRRPNATYKRINEPFVILFTVNHRERWRTIIWPHLNGNLKFIQHFNFITRWASFIENRSYFLHFYHAETS
jgi:hypothetical protein